MPVDDKDQKREIDRLNAEIRRLRGMLRELTPPLPAMLRRRGFRIYKKEPRDDLLIPGRQHLDDYYEMLKRYSFRLFLRDVIKHQPVFTLIQATRYATKEVTREYIGYLADIGLVTPDDNAFRLTRGPIKSFGETLEWFLAEIFHREFSAETIWGVKMKRPLVGGDYDLLAKLEGSILYMEVKSSPPRQIYQNEISAFVDRVLDLLPALALFFEDTELRMKDKIVPMFEDEMASRSLTGDIVRVERELFEVTGPWPAGMRVFIINAKDSIIQNIETVLSRFFRREP
jgi:hypothetical protein